MYWDGNSVPWERKDYSREATVITDDVISFVKWCLDEDAHCRSKKQHHTAKRIYDRLVEEYGFTGGETTVRRLVHQLREKTRKALMTLRLTQCHQNWLTMMAGSANFDDRSMWKYNALSLKNHNLIAVPSGSTENRYGVEPLTDSSCPYFSRVKSRISYVDRGHPKDCVNLRCGAELTNIFAATPTIN